MLYTEVLRQLHCHIGQGMSYAHCLLFPTRKIRASRYKKEAFPSHKWTSMMYIFILGHSLSKIMLISRNVMTMVCKEYTAVAQYCSFFLDPLSMLKL